MLSSIWFVVTLNRVSLGRTNGSGFLICWRVGGRCGIDFFFDWTSFIVAAFIGARFAFHGRFQSRAKAATNQRIALLVPIRSLMARWRHRSRRPPIANDGLVSATQSLTNQLFLVFFSRVERSILPRFTAFSREFSYFYLVLLRYTGFYLILPICSRFH